MPIDVRAAQRKSAKHHLGAGSGRSRRNEMMPSGRLPKHPARPHRAKNHSRWRGWAAVSPQAGDFGAGPVWARHETPDVRSIEVPLEDERNAVGATPAGVKVTASNRIPAVHPNDPTAHKCPRVP